MKASGSNPLFSSIRLLTPEQGQSIFIERQMSFHKNLYKARSSNFSSTHTFGSSDSSPLLHAQAGNYGSSNGGEQGTIRFQVVVWYIGKLDVVTGSVPMTFRVTLFWNDQSMEDDEEVLFMEDSCSVNSSRIWKMHGRQQAFQHEIKDMPSKAVDVPPLSILNVATFEIIGSPEVDMLNEESRLMRWTCMYRATVLQDNLSVENFPHDRHDISVKFAILSHRRAGKRWDKRYWKLALASHADSQHSTRIPYGLIVDQVRMPDFHFNKERGLQFEFSTLQHGSFDPNRGDEAADEQLNVTLSVLRESGYYDQNIVPLLALLNVVAASVLTLEDTSFFNRGLLMLNIAFVEMGIRMTTDSHLPSVGYEIRLQRILNEFFCVLMILVLESMFVYVLRVYYSVDTIWTSSIDWCAGLGALAHNIITVGNYYRTRRNAVAHLKYSAAALGKMN